MSEIIVRSVDPHIVEVKIQPANTEINIIRIHRTSEGEVGISWPLLQGANTRIARLYAEALMVAARIAEELMLPCPHCGGELQIHREQLTTTRDVVCGHVYRCIACSNIIG